MKWPDIRVGDAVRHPRMEATGHFGSIKGEAREFDLIAACAYPGREMPPGFKTAEEWAAEKART